MLRLPCMLLFQDEHEICFVDDESFRVLSEVDPKAEASLYKYIEKDEKRRKV